MNETSTSHLKRKEMYMKQIQKMFFSTMIFVTSYQLFERIKFVFNEGKHALRFECVPFNACFFAISLF